MDICWIENTIEYNYLKEYFDELKSDYFINCSFFLGKNRRNYEK